MVCHLQWRQQSAIMLSHVACLLHVSRCVFLGTSSANPLRVFSPLTIHKSNTTADLFRSHYSQQGKYPQWVFWAGPEKHAANTLRVKAPMNTALYITSSVS